jgi:hypothetical protein
VFAVAHPQITLEKYWILALYPNHQYETTLQNSAIVGHYHATTSSHHPLMATHRSISLHASNTPNGHDSQEFGADIQASVWPPSTNEEEPTAQENTLQQKTDAKQCQDFDEYRYRLLMTSSYAEKKIND